MSLNVGELVAFLELDKANFDRDVDRSESKFSGLMGKMGRAAVTGGAVAGAALAGVAFKGLKEFATLERGMNEVFTLLPGISGDAMDELTEQVRTFSKDFGVLPDKVVPALYQALSAGVPSGNVFDFLETANKAALGGVTDLEVAVDGISSVINAYGDDVIDAGEASDLMFTAVRLGKTTFDELSRSLFNVLPSASAMGVSFGDVTAAMAQMTAQGVPTSVATTQLRQLMVELSKSGTAASDAFKEASGVGMKQFMDEGGNMADVLDIMQQAADDNGVSLQDMFGSVEAGAAALALGGDNADGYRGALKEMDDSAGATEAAHEQMDQGLGRAWESIKANTIVALGEMGEALAPTVQKFADAFSEDGIGGVVDVAIDLWYDALPRIEAWFHDGFVPWWEGTAVPWMKYIGGKMGAALVNALQNALVEALATLPFADADAIKFTPVGNPVSRPSSGGRRSGGGGGSALAFHDGGLAIRGGLAELAAKERVLSPRQTEAFERLVEAVERGGGRGLAGRAGGDIIVEHLEVKAFTDRFDLRQVQDDLALRGVA